MVILYTAAIGPRSTIGDLKFTLPTDYTAYSFSWPRLNATGWGSFDAVMMDCDMRRVARKYKALPHKIVPNADYWVWYDAALTPSKPPTELIEKMEEEGAELAAYKHPRRTCAYEEAYTAAGERQEVAQPRDHPAILQAQRERYEAEGFPQDWGLWENGFLIRKNTRIIREFNELWWKEICLGSREDQVSMPYALWKLGVKTMKFGPEKVHESAYIRDTGHVGLNWDSYR